MKIKAKSIQQLFPSPLMQVQLDLDVEKLTEFAVQMQEQDNIGAQKSNVRGWQSKNVYEEKHEEFEKLKKEINQYLQEYNSEVFCGMKFRHDVKLCINNIWININGKYHYNEWHTHPQCTLSGVYYIKHDGTEENGLIAFKHPIPSGINLLYLDGDLIETPNEVTAEKVCIIPASNALMIFPSWLEHRVYDNLKDDVRISLSFNAFLLHPDAYYHIDQFEPEWKRAHNDNT